MYTDLTRRPHTQIHAGSPIRDSRAAAEATGRGNGAGARGRGKGAEATGQRQRDEARGKGKGHRQGAEARGRGLREAALQALDFHIVMIRHPADPPNYSGVCRWPFCSCLTFNILQQPFPQTLQFRGGHRLSKSQAILGPARCRSRGLPSRWSSKQSEPSGSLMWWIRREGSERTALFAAARAFSPSG